MAAPEQGIDLSRIFGRRDLGDMERVVGYQGKSFSHRGWPNATHPVGAGDSGTIDCRGCEVNYGLGDQRGLRGLKTPSGHNYSVHGASVGRTSTG